MIDQFPNTVSRDLLYMIIGKQLGSGAYRRVFEYLPDPSLVIKVEDGAGRFQNALEWQHWNDLKETKIGKWLAPCVSISDNGIYLLQKKATFPEKSKYPKKIPGIFTDKKYDNYGFIGKQLVCVDYAVVCWKFNDKLIKSKWWDLKDA